jgi:hexulose-6-phosphate isomerase
LSKQHHLAIPSLNLAFMAETPSLVQPGDLSTRAKHAVLGALTVASAIGAGVVLVPFMGKNSIEVEKEMKNAAANLANLAETAEEAGVVLGIESTLNFDQQQFLLDQLGNSPCAKIYYDTGDALVRKFDVATGIRDLGAERIAQVHLKDARIAEGKAPDYNVNLGEGDLDYRAVANALRAIGFDGWIILETPPGNDAIANGKKNLQFADLKSVV